MAGADSVMKTIRQRMEVNLEGDQLVKSITVERAPCLGLCEHAPALLVQGAATSASKNPTWEELVAGKLKWPKPPVAGDIRILTANCGKVKPTLLPEYEAVGDTPACELHCKPIA
jgi:NADH-quinone oxidoreductase subunit F